MLVRAGDHFRDACSRGPLAVVLLLATACSELPLLEFEQCGNGLTEPLAGEDCDSRENETLGVGLRCGAADSGAAACRYTCGDLGGTCPLSWTCGPDGICRRHTPRFALAAESRIDIPATRLTVTDLDADGHDDVVVHPDRRLTALFSDGTGKLEDRYEVDIGRALGDADVIPAASGPPALVVPLAAGLHVMRANEARVLEGIAHAPYDLTTITDGRVRLLTVSRAGAPQDEVLLMFDSPAGLAIAAGFGASARVVLPGITLADLPEAPSVADLEGEAHPFRSDEILIAARGGTRAFVVRQACASLAPFEFCPQDDLLLELRDEVVLPGPLEGGARILDVDGDGRLDLFASVRIAQVERIVWAPQEPDGHFGRARVDPRIAVACNGGCTQLWPLAAGDLNADGPADFVLPEGILQTLTHGATTAAPLALVYSPSLGAVGQLTDAALGDFNRDGRTDVAVAGQQADGVELLLAGPRVIFGAFFQATDGRPRDLTVGDFDGDLVDDLAIVLDDDTGSQVAVLYGDTQGPLQPPIEMGRFGFVQQILAALVLGADIGPIDTRWDLLLQTTEARVGDGAESSGVLIGTAGRNMLAPYVLTLGIESEAPVGVAAAFVDDVDGGADLVALTSSATWVVASGLSPTYAADAASRLRTCGLQGWSECVVTRPGPDRDRVFALSPAYPCVPNLLDAPTRLYALAPRAVGDALSCVQSELPDNLRAPIAATWADVDPGTPPKLLVAFHGLAGARQSVAEHAGVAILTVGTTGEIEASEVLETDPAVGSIWGVGAANLDDDPELELLVGTDTGVRLAKRVDGAWGLSSPLRLDLPETETLRTLALTDLNADGLLDLLIGTGEGLYIATALEGRVSEGSPR